MKLSASISNSNKDQTKHLDRDAGTVLFSLWEFFQDREGTSPGSSAAMAKRMDFEETPATFFSLQALVSWLARCEINEMRPWSTRRRSNGRSADACKRWLATHSGPFSPRCRAQAVPRGIQVKGKTFQMDGEKQSIKWKPIFLRKVLVLNCSPSNVLVSCELKKKQKTFI